MTIGTGTLVGSYEIQSHVGSGGMGEVFRARDRRIGRDVAIKFLGAEYSADVEALARFEREARAAGSISHPNLVTIHDIGVHEGAPYIVMELLEGTTLRERIESGGRSKTTSRPLATRAKILDYAAQIAAGLGAAHERGIVHRDLKPENIFVTRSGHVKVLDFGVARFSGNDGIAGDLDTLETEPGKIIGTVSYMAPEHLLGGTVDHRSDIFSLGVLLYEMIAGRRPFEGDTMVQTIASILRDDPEPLREEVDGVSRGVAVIVKRCLEKSPDERYQSARDVSFALEAATASAVAAASQGESIVPRRGWRRAALGTLVALLVLASAFGLIAALRRGPAAEINDFVQLTFDQGLEDDPSIAPDGSSFVYVSRASGNADIWLQRVGGDKATNLTADSLAPDTEPVFSPDGRQVAFRSERAGGGIFVMGATGESVRRMTDFGHSPAWSPDGARLVFATESITDPAARIAPSRLYIVEVETGRVSLFYNGDAVEPDWSPDGRRIAYWGLPDGTSERAIWTIPATGGAPARVTEPHDRAINWRPVWAPDGEHLYFVSDRGGSMNIWRIPIDADGTAGGPPEPATRSAFWCGHPSITRDGKTLAFSTRSNEGAVFKIHIDRATLTLGRPESVLAGSRRILSPVPSPDGKWVALSTLGIQEDLFIVRSDGTGLRQITNDAYRDRVPRWSPDGKQLIFHSDRAGKYTLWTIRLDGSGLRQVTPEAMTEGVYSPDGRTLSAVFVDPRAGRGAKSRRPVLLHTADPRSPIDLPEVSDKEMFWPAAWSPDGRHLVGLTLDDGGFKTISTYTLATRRYSVISETAKRAGWLDGNTIVLVEQDGAVSLFDLATRTSKPVGILPLFNPMRAPNIDAATDTIYYVSLSTEADIWSVELPD
ncbi:MAG: protein kinase [Thermoanaerobaculia bacterium]